MLKRILIFSIGVTSLATAADLERGKTIYAQLCFNCHGPKLEGGQGPSLVDAYWQHGSSPDAILKVIDKGVPGSPMIAYEAVFPEADRIALRDFILSEQDGLRETVRSIYPREYFRGKRLTPELFDSVDSLSQTPLPENHYYFPRNGDGVLRGRSKLYVREPGNYRFNIRLIGRTSVYLNGDEVHYSDEKTDKSTHVNKTIDLEPGVHDLEILHEEKTGHSYRFAGFFEKVGGDRIALNGRSLQGNIPKIIKARPEMAQVVRKWIDGLPPRALLCLLPNEVIVAFHPNDGRVLKAWHSAAINQTPSLPDRSAKPSEIRGKLISGEASGGWPGSVARFVRYEVDGEKAILVARIDGVEKKAILAPDGSDSYTLIVE